MWTRLIIASVNLTLVRETVFLVVDVKVERMKTALCYGRNFYLLFDADKQKVLVENIDYST